VTGFYQEWITEMKKVTWPGRKDTLSSTAVVIVVVLIIVAFLGLVDFASDESPVDPDLLTPKRKR